MQIELTDVLADLFQERSQSYDSMKEEMKELSKLFNADQENASEEFRKDIVGLRNKLTSKCNKYFGQFLVCF